MFYSSGDPVLFVLAQGDNSYLKQEQQLSR